MIQLKTTELGNIAGSKTFLGSHSAPISQSAPCHPYLGSSRCHTSLQGPLRMEFRNSSKRGKISNHLIIFIPLNHTLLLWNQWNKYIMHLESNLTVNRTGWGLWLVSLIREQRTHGRFVFFFLSRKHKVSIIFYFWRDDFLHHHTNTPQNQQLWMSLLRWKQHCITKSQIYNYISY